MIRQTIPAVISILYGASWVFADPPASLPQGAQATSGLHAVRVASNSGRSPAPSKKPDAAARHELFGADRPYGSKPGEHPLMPALRWAKETLPAIENLKDYSATFVKRERVNGEVGRRQCFFIKIRHKPFSVYSRGLAPASIKGQEVIYVAGQDDGKLWAHPAGFRGRLVHAVALKPDGIIAMRGQRYPITEIGIFNMVKHLVAVAEQDLQHDECEVTFFSAAKINGRTCTWFQVVHPLPRPYFRFHLRGSSWMTS